MRILMTGLLIGFALPGTSRAGEIRAEYHAEMAKELLQYSIANADWMIKFYKDLHQHPELSLHEKESSRKIAVQFKRYGYTVTEHVGGYGVVGVLKNGEGPTILVRADMDALPVTEETGLPYASKEKAIGSNGETMGVMHACGHDIHQTNLVGTAALLAKFKSHWRGTLVMIAQPAEEIGTGALSMINDGLFTRFPKPNYCLALHVSSDLPVGSVGYTPGWALANVDSVDITIHGRGGHGSRPNETIDPIVAAAQVIMGLQTIVSRRVDPTEPGVVTVGSIHAGSKHNIIPNTAKLQITVRSYTDDTRKILLDGIRDITVNTCRAMGCQRDPDVVVREAEFTPATYNDPGLTRAAIRVIEEVLGSENVVEEKPKMGGEDFGRYSKASGVPGFIYWLGSVNRDVYNLHEAAGSDPLPPLHSSKYAPDTVYTIRAGVMTMTALVMALMDRP